jgi:hypothetical protein
LVALLRIAEARSGISIHRFILNVTLFSPDGAKAAARTDEIARRVFAS